MMKGGLKVDAKILIWIMSLLVFAALVLMIVNALIFMNDNKPGAVINDDNLAKDCLLMADAEEMIQCVDETSFDYYMQDDCDKAMKIYADVPEGMLDKTNLAFLYNEAYSMSLSCGDELSQENWKEKYENIANQLENYE